MYQPLNGTLTDSTYTNTETVRQIYNTLLSSRIRNVSTGFVTPQDYSTNLKNSRTFNVISIGGLYFKYATFIDNATVNGKLTYSNNQFYDKYSNGIWQNPYQERQTFAMAPAIKVYKGHNLTVKLPSSTFYSNHQSQIQSVQINFDNGQGYVTIPFNQNTNITYTGSGVKTWTYKLNLTNGSALYCRSRIKIQEGLNTVPYYGGGSAKNSTAKTQGGNNPLRAQTITANKAYLGEFGQVRLTCDLIDGNTRITRPLIVAEGFDVGVVLEPEKVNGNFDYEDFRDFVQESLSTDLRNLIWDDVTKDYDIIYVDWDNGVDYLQRNAYALEAVIDWVNNEKWNNGSFEQNVVLGQSMGGVIARYALADIEKDGNWHDTRLFISHDAPQQGANVPSGMQFMYRHLTNQYIRTSQKIFGNTIIIPIAEIGFGVSNYLSLLDAPGAKQLLKNTSNLSYVMQNTDHTTFYNELKNGGFNGSNGYPTYSRNVSLSNGSECGTNQNFWGGDLLLDFDFNKGLSFWGDLFSLIYNPLGGVIGGSFVDSKLFGIAALGLIPGHSRYKADFEIRATHLYDTSNLAYKGKISYTKKVLYLFPVTINITDVQKVQPPNILPFDYFGGGYFDTTTLMDTAGLPSGVFVRDRFGFIPTPSALDIGENNVALGDQDYESSYVGASPPSNPKNTPFDNFSTEFNVVDGHNHRHITFNTRNGDWLAAEIEGNNITTTDCEYLCGGYRKITGDANLCFGSSTFGASQPSTAYNWSITQGASLVNVSGTNTPTLAMSVVGSNTGLVTISLVQGGTCGNAPPITKTIAVGSSEPILFSADPDPNKIYAQNDSCILYFEDQSGNQYLNPSNFEFILDPYSNFSFSGVSGNVVPLYCNTAAPFLNLSFQARIKNDCGWGPWKQFTYFLQGYDPNYNGFQFSMISGSGGSQLELNIAEAPTTSSNNTVQPISGKIGTNTNKKEYLNMDTTQEVYKIRILDIYGRTKFLKNKNRKKKTYIDSSLWPSGIYYARVSNRNGKVQTKGVAIE
ncbi:T9SS type A sorting domain-containing protein [Algibacter sp. 2305UL17-15]|uniref:T9SS type A sorting domain-containing protein n=1 Tax=Algibacter sp. 2305UL17-15 TaxID=3231268 RepID=UPI0034577F10